MFLRKDIDINDGAALSVLQNKMNDQVYEIAESSELFCFETGHNKLALNFNSLRSRG